MQKEHNKSQLPAHNLDDFKYRNIDVRWTYHGGPFDDLASAGLLLEGLRKNSPPNFQDPDNPTPLDLRRLAIYENYRALADTKPGGGFGEFYGPKELIPGLEVAGVLEDHALAIVQIPETFEPAQGKILLVPASSSRGVYGGILISEWALAKGYAVVLCDKGCGTGFQNLTSNLTVALDGRLVDADSEELVSFKVPDTPEEVKSFSSHHPHRFATKHAHSGLNVEAKWGLYVRQSLDFCHAALSKMWPDTYQREKAWVVATGLSNGGGAALRAAEEDSEGAIHAVVVGEPNVTPVFDPTFVIQQGQNPPLSEHSKSLLEYATFQSVFQLAANYSESGCQSSLRRLRALQLKGFCKELPPSEASQKSQEKLYQMGLLREQAVLASSHAAHGVYDGMAVALVNCLGRFLVTDHLFGYSYAAVDQEVKVPTTLGAKTQSRIYALANGLVPTAGVELINDRSVGGPVQNLHSISPSSALADGNLDGAAQLYTAAWGKDPVTGNPPKDSLDEVSVRVRRGLEETKATGDLHGKPCIIVNGRCDSIIAPNHASRSYLGRNLRAEGEGSQLSYIELEHAQHLDALNGLPIFGERFVPLLPYLFEALELMDNKGTTDSALPKSQVVRTKPRAKSNGELENLRREHIPFISKSPKDEDKIQLSDAVLVIPE